MVLRNVTINAKWIIAVTSQWTPTLKYAQLMDIGEILYKFHIKYTGISEQKLPKNWA
jgi:hypothetical protein